MVRESVEDLYAGDEHIQIPTVAECLKVISFTVSEKVIRLALESAAAEGRERVCCATKENITELTDRFLQPDFGEIFCD